MKLRATDWIPLTRATNRPGVRSAFGTGFYLLVVLAVVRGTAWTAMSPVDRLLALGAGVLLYCGAVWPVALLPPGLRAAARRLGDDHPARAAMAVLGIMLSLAAAAPLVTHIDPAQLSSPSRTRYEAPSVRHPMGTDRFGRDVWARVAYGGRASFGVCVVSVSLAVLLGTLVGALSGVARRSVDDAVMRVVDGMLAFPRLLLLLTAVAFVPPGAAMLALLIGATSWMGVARIVRGEVRRMRSREFVEAAIAAGVGRARLVGRHMLPNAMGHVIVAGTLNAGTVILLESSLSFLGLGVQPPAPSWGSMIFEGRDALSTAWWVSAFPALVITLAVVALNMVGDGLRDAMDARSTSA